MKTKIVKVDEVKIESLIKKNFSEAFMRKIYDIYSDDCMSIVEKTILFDKIFTEEFGHRKDYRRIGEGTNRFVCLLDNHIIKVAYNYLAFIDNMNELAQSKYKKKYLAQAFETNGIILVSEYVTVMDKEEFLENQNAIYMILKQLEEDKSLVEGKEKFYILGDMGMSNKNYGNWGRRMNGDIVVLDYGYLYQMNSTNWKEVSRCPVCGSSLKYTDDFSELVCTKTECHTKVKYTTLRNSFGYANIIENIKENLNNDKYIKFDNNGEIIVDVMEKVEVEDENVIEFTMPEEIVNKINKARDKFFEIYEIVKEKERLNLDKIYRIKEEIYDEEQDYDEMLLPYVIASLELTYNNADKYLKDFNKIADARYNEIYKELKNEFETKKSEEIKDDGEPDYYDETEEYTVKGYESNIKMVDLYADDENKKVTSLDLLLGDTVDDMFSNFCMVDDNINKIDDSEEYTLDHIFKLLEANDELKQDDVEEISEEDKELNAEEELKEAYKKLEDALTKLITTRYELLGCKEDSEEDYTTGDVYRTYLNGDYIDLEYSPRVNAKNILGGWEPDKFAFPLYRHMLLKFDYDMEMVDMEYEAIYRIEETVEIPTDIYSNVENRGIVVGQILNRFEDDCKPPRHLVITTIGKELTDYYEALDDYYDTVKTTKVEVGTNDPDYYLRTVENNESIAKMIRDAKNELKDELLDKDMRLEDLMSEYKIGYYYDIESIMNKTELNILDIIKSSYFTNVNNIKEFILNKYYVEYGNVLPDSIFDIFKYNGSIVKEEGCETHPRLVRPRLKAKLIRKDSNEDSYKPDIFNKIKYQIVMVEQRYEILINLNDPEEKSKLADIRAALNRKDLYFSEGKINKYNVRKSKDNLRFGLTEKEIEILEAYEGMLGTVTVKDNERLFKKAIVEVLDRKYNFSNETKEFMNDLYKHDLSEAYANRLFKINVLELNGCITRLDYLAQID